MKGMTTVEQKINDRLFREIYEQYRASMYRVAYSVLRDEGHAEDAVQQTFIKLYNEIEKIDDPSSNKTRAFIVILVRNTAIDLYRKRKREQVVYFEDLERIPHSRGSSPEQCVIDNQSEQAVAQLLDSLGEKYSSILLLRYCHGYRNKEIAELLGMTEANVASRIFQAKRLLTRRLEHMSLREA